MSTDRKSIAQIKKEFAEAKEGSLEEMFAQYAMDERSGVKAVLNSYRKKQEKLAKERVRLEEMRSYEHQYERYGYVCGIDEAGRGPLAGPVVAGAVILPEDCEILWLNDSKQLSEKKREALYDEIMEKALAVSVGMASPARIDEINILQATYEAMREAIAGLKSNNAQGEFYLTDALETAKAAGKVGAFAAPDPLTVEGVSDRVQLAALSKTYNRRVCERWMRDGVTILDPETTWIEDDVQIGRDATILPGSFLQGHTVVGEDAIVGPYTTLIDATVDEGAVVERSRVQESHIGARTNIGPWTYLRPGNEFGEDAKAGAFVEMKKAHIGNGTKVPHLSYVGDAQLGDHTNIGGGTITANYDGVHKNRTTIGSGCHVGAGNLFVAPVEVGDNVTTGAGSVVRHAVPSDTMVYSENTQHNVEGWKPAWER